MRKYLVWIALNHEKGIQTICYNPSNIKQRKFPFFGYVKH